ncbi:Oar protein [Lysobacter dokdonensis DS-58]|uniref:Oar protein n=1 Tax=Lysobacter dokdonensis DS-58 TaxID=1300345 RepID=A0A0A2WIQ6_9GAMM|nr:carboxypeptidase-like regulatory domain-containing protein [Lysobacter dokdonensis]KGQ18130.1 Oar protein [Lysobacter dokdonensis DS-58]
MIRLPHRVLAAIAALCLSISCAYAQYSGGGLWGRAKAGDVVHIENADTGVKQDQTLAEDGKYRFERIPVGVYTITITHADGTVDPPKKARVALGTNTYVK